MTTRKRNGFSRLECLLALSVVTLALQLVPQHLAMGAAVDILDGALLYGENGDGNEEGVLKTWNSRTNFSKLTDGLSKTFVVMEASLWAANHGGIYDGDVQHGGILGDDIVPEQHQETPATRDYDIFAWLFSQRRGHWSYPPGFAPLPWWNWAAIGGMVCLVYLVWRSRARKSAALGHYPAS